MTKDPSAKRAHLESQSKQESLFTSIVLILVTVVMSIFFFVQADKNTPIAREEAKAYTGIFESYEPSGTKKDGILTFANGRRYSIATHCEDEALRADLLALEKGTKLSVLADTREYVLEIKTDSELLLSFETTEKSFASRRNGMLVAAWLILAADVVLLAITIGERIHKKKPQASSKTAKANPEKESPILRHADFDRKYRILLEAKVEGFTILYRRGKQVNELVINRQVYDEMKALIEFEHTLSATVKGHRIEAGLDEYSHSYIRFDGELVAYQNRII